MEDPQKKSKMWRIIWDQTGSEDVGRWKGNVLGQPGEIRVLYLHTLSTSNAQSKAILALLGGRKRMFLSFTIIILYFDGDSNFQWRTALLFFIFILRSATYRNDWMSVHYFFFCTTTCCPCRKVNLVYCKTLDFRFVIFPLCFTLIEYQHMVYINSSCTLTLHICFCMANHFESVFNPETAEKASSSNSFPNLYQ